MARRRRDAEVLEPPIPVELAAVPRVNRDRSTLITRRRQVRELLVSKQSTELRLINEGLVSAAMVMDPKVYNAPAPNAVTRTWMHAAYGYANTVPELNAVRMYVGNALSRCTLAVGKRNPDGSVEQGYDGEEPVEDLDNAVAEEAAGIISDIRSPRGGQSELLRASGEQMFMCGEFYYVPNDTPQGMQFDVLSTQELLRDGASWTKYLGPGYGAVPLAPGVNPIRVWRPDGQWSMLATSSVRACLEILEELVVLTRLVRSSAISRMALAGILCIPDELDNPDEEEGPDGGQSEAMNPLAVDMINTGAKAIDDPANASAWMPFIVQGPAEYLQHLRHIPFEASSNEQVMQRTEAIMRLARGLDVPVEIVTGHADTTFANACVDPETEILTSEGWRSYEDLNIGDLVRTLNHKTGLAEWQPVEHIHVYEAQDDLMLVINGKAHDSFSTENHRWPVLDLTAGGKRSWQTSETLKATHRIICAAPEATPPSEIKYSDEFVELVAWHWTEGHVYRYKQDVGVTTISQSGSANPAKCDRIRAVLYRLLGPPERDLKGKRGQGRAWTERRDAGRDMRRYVVSRAVTADLEAVAPHKRVSESFILALTPAQLELFIDVSLLGDGWRNNVDSRVISQAKSEMLDGIELACILSGRTAYRWTGEARSYKTHYLALSEKVTQAVPVKTVRNERVAHREWVRYSGIVWCPTTRNGTWMARRNGKVYFTGNSQVNIDVFRSHLEPTLQMICDALTVAYLWPTMAKARGIDADHLAAGEPYPDDILSVAVTYDAHHLISAPDRVKEISDIYQHDPTQMSIKISEIRDALNLDPGEVVDPMEVAARVDAIRLTKIRETIAAPPSDAAVGISSIDQAVIPGESAGSQLIENIGTAGQAGVTASGDLLAHRIAGALEVTVSRSVERLGAKLRSKAKNGEREKWASTANADLARRLGPLELERLLGPSPDESVKIEVSALASHTSEWAADAGLDHPMGIGRNVHALALATIEDHVRTGAPKTVSLETVKACLMAERTPARG